MSSQDLIDAAIATLATASDWCQGACARKADGVACPIGHPDAVAWDIYGALVKAHWDSSDQDFTFLTEAYETLSGRIPSDYKSRDIEAWNDDSDYNTVMNLLNDNL